MSIALDGKVLQLSACNSHEMRDKLITVMYRNCMNSLLDQIKASEYFSTEVHVTQDTYKRQRTIDILHTVGR